MKFNGKAIAAMGAAMLGITCAAVGKAVYDKIKKNKENEDLKVNSLGSLSDPREFGREPFTSVGANSVDNNDYLRY